jgi:hypothetical protein
MPVPLATPVNREAQPAKEFASAWFSRITINAPTPSDKGVVRINVAAYDAASGEVLTDSDGNPKFIKRIATNDLTDAAANVPEVATAYAAIIAAIPALEAYEVAKAATPEPEPEE